MAKKISLREFQQSVSDKLQGLSDAAPSASKLGVRVGAEFWLVDLADVSEAIPVPALADVPLTQPWFRGVANIRGNLYSIVDFSAFMGGDATPINMDSRLLLVHQQFSINAGFVINRMLGLRGPEQFQRKSSNDSPLPWVGAEYTDAEGNTWKELNMQELVNHPDFLQVGM
jgi:twitching motility protein PilI